MTDNNTPKTFKALLKKHIQDYFDRHDSIDEINHLHPTIIAEVEKLLIKITLDRTNNNKLHAARILGINRNTLNQKVKKFAL